jgi:hypothetical protein
MEIYASGHFTFTKKNFITFDFIENTRLIYNLFNLYNLVELFNYYYNLREGKNVLEQLAIYFKFK